MIGCTSYARCDCCSTRMHGILSPEARTTCHGCGGRPLIADAAWHQALVRKAKDRVGRMDRPRPIPPRRPDGKEAA